MVSTFSAAPDQQLGKQLGRCQFFFPVFWRYPQDHVHDQYHRGPESAVSEGYKNKKCVPEWHRTGKDVISGQWKRSKEMDSEVPELGSGPEPADRAIWRTADTVSIKRKSQGGHNSIIWPPQPYSIGIYSIARKSQPYSGGRVWAEPTKKQS